MENPNPPKQRVLIALRAVDNQGKTETSLALVQELERAGAKLTKKDSCYVGEVDTSTGRRTIAICPYGDTGLIIRDSFNEVCGEPPVVPDILVLTTRTKRGPWNETVAITRENQYQLYCLSPMVSETNRDDAYTQLANQWLAKSLVHFIIDYC